MRVLRSSTIEKLINYLEKNPNDSALIKLSEQERMNIKNFDGSRKQVKVIAQMLHDELGEENVDKLISRMTSLLDREKFSKTNITVHGDTKRLLDRKMSQLDYDSLDELLNDALIDFFRY